MALVKTSPVVLAASVLCLVRLFCEPDMLQAQSSSRPATAKTVTGEVSAVEGEFRMRKNARGEDTLKMVDKSYVIVTRAGEELRLELNDDTKIPSRANPGDKVEANISREGQTLSVKLLQ